MSREVNYVNRRQLEKNMLKRNSTITTVTLFVVFSSSLLFPAVEAFKLRVAQFNVASRESSGMNGGLWGSLLLGGGEFRIKICNQVNAICCETKDPLETINNDWERSEINFFIGDALQECENFMMTKNVQLTLIHEGSDGGELDSVRFYGSDFGYGRDRRDEIFCPLGEKLDGYTSKSVDCTFRPLSPFDYSRSCNGHEDFCTLPYNRYTFLGAHNAGTGEDSSSIPHINCAFENHDLDIKEQLDFGIRFFDFDVIKSKSLYNCDGLETGHGRYPGLGLYRCFGRMEKVLQNLVTWLDEMGNRDVVTLYFGAIDFEDTTFPELSDLFKMPFIRDRLNRNFKQKNTWPTLGEAISSNKNIFVFMRRKEPIQEDFLHREIPYDKVKENSVCEGDVIVTSTFKKGFIGEDCQSTVRNAHEFCHNKGDFLKVAAFNRGFSELLCLWESARACNPRLRDVLDTCRSKGANINFVQMDYPNFLGEKGIIPIDTILDFNRENL